MHIWWMDNFQRCACQADVKNWKEEAAPLLAISWLVFVAFWRRIVGGLSYWKLVWILSKWLYGEETDLPNLCLQGSMLVFSRASEHRFRLRLQLSGAARAMVCSVNCWIDKILYQWLWPHLETRATFCASTWLLDRHCLLSLEGDGMITEGILTAGRCLLAMSTKSVGFEGTRGIRICWQPQHRHMLFSTKVSTKCDLGVLYREIKHWQWFTIR